MGAIESTAGTKVLVVDDEPTMRMLLRTAMKKDGFEVIEANNGVECLERYQQARPDIVLMDAMMPEMDGFSSCAALQGLQNMQDAPDKYVAPVLMITSLDDKDSVDRAFAAGAADYITKPIHWPLLHQRVRRLQDIVHRQRAENQIKASLKEKEAMLKEIHHRVKNNLQIISSLLNLQSSAIEDEEIVNLFRESQNRVRLMAIIHEKLYQSNDLGKINFREYIQALTSHLLQSYDVNKTAIDLKVDIEDISLEIDVAVPCGLIVNELVSNSLKYAFPDNFSPVGDSETAPKQIPKQIKIAAGLESDRLLSIRYCDNGIGLPPGFDIDTARTLGLQLVSTLTEQLDGQLTVNSCTGKTEFILTELHLC